MTEAKFYKYIQIKFLMKVRKFNDKRRAQFGFW